MDVVFVLVAPAVPENVGASCRALKTMGFHQLRLVATEAHAQKQARILAHGSTDVLEGARHYDSLQAALADVDLSIGTSAKARHPFRSLTPAHELAPVLANKAGTLGRVAVVFGCEASGLSNDDVIQCDLVSNIALGAPYPSLNLAQAVMLYAYELRGLALGAQQPEAPSDAQQYRALREKVSALLQAHRYGPESKLARWALEMLPKADTKAIGFLHALCDKLHRPTRSDEH
ncbi:tRNA/rRNA methyltransferase [Simiduia sp. 21SJ11W-1]|uniref:tRNA/rRNA methyltransferase n=1 Tax=Simiduia sp. 21SJ11W-1 TaxID=2909669 RepID=UPI0020A0AD8B|nr:tRNA/rRNA methyltransferase [Simiduia sp. 21SJ11W-1]UTA47758.1 tRNA/rRNA methyltransferase [Simiduia sp. 21SJ11W-1]